MFKRIEADIPSPSPDLAARICAKARHTPQAFTRPQPFWLRWQVWFASGVAGMMSLGGVAVMPALTTAQTELDDQVDVAYMVVHEENQNNIEFALAFVE